MIELKHTPKPWDENGLYVILRYADKHDMDFEKSEENMPYSREDAKLIAAAPEMLEALIKWHKIIFDKKYTDDSMLESQSRALIEKATGLKIEEVLK